MKKNSGKIRTSANTSGAQEARLKTAGMGHRAELAQNIFHCKLAY